MERPTGALLGSVFVGDNSALMKALAPLYFTGSVLDMTYGRGGWWRTFQPHPFVGHDLKTDGVDFTNLPEDDASFDTVCFDPPYIPAGGHGTSTKLDFRDRFGLPALTQLDVDTMMANGLIEAARVARCWVLGKCCDYVNGGRFTLGHLKMIDAARAAGLGEPWDLIVHHTGSGPGGHNIYTPIRARRCHSYLLVWKVPRHRATPANPQQLSASPTPSVAR